MSLSFTSIKHNLMSVFSQINKVLSNIGQCVSLNLKVFHSFLVSKKDHYLMFFTTLFRGARFSFRSARWMSSRTCSNSAQILCRKSFWQSSNLFCRVVSRATRSMLAAMSEVVFLGCAAPSSSLHLTGAVGGRREALTVFCLGTSPA